jgi:hypothetical protein
MGMYYERELYNFINYLKVLNIFRMGHFFKKGKKFLFRSIIHKHKREEEEEEEEETD